MGNEKYLRQFIRYEITPTEFMEKYYDDEFKSSYKPTSDDLIAACRNMIEADVNWDMLYDWYMYVIEDLNPNFEGLEGVYYDNECLWGDTDHNVVRLMLQVIDNRINNEDYDDVEGGMKGFFEQMIRMAESCINNHKYPPEEWLIEPIQAELLFLIYGDRTEKIPEKYVGLFKRLVEEGCKNDNYLAMRIKGYGCYGGDNLYECDWNESRDLITRMFEKSGDPVLANTLGYIYYYGRCNNGEPEYEKAFQYYAVGAASGLLESIYKQADMFKHGKGCIKSQRAAETVYKRLYDECRPRFCRGDDASFADIALRRASVYKEHGYNELAYKTFLEADYAIKKRMKKSNFFGNQKVQENIAKSLEETRAELPEDFFVDKIEMGHPYLLFDLIDDGMIFKASIEPISDNHYKLILELTHDDEGRKLFIAVPQLDYVDLTDVIEIEFVTDKVIEFECDSDDEALVDSLHVTDDGYAFAAGGEDMITLRDVIFVFRKPDKH